jgi:hypothetical protein
MRIAALAIAQPGPRSDPPLPGDAHLNDPPLGYAPANDPHPRDAHFRGSDVTKLLSTSEFPDLPADPVALADAAEAYAKKARTIVDAGEAVRERWRKLPGVYDAPEADTAVARMDGVRESAAELGAAADSIASALLDFATVLGNCRTSLDTLRDDVTAARDAEARQREEWEETHASDERYEIDDRILRQDADSRDLLAQIKRTLLQAEDDCVSALARVTGGTGEELPQPLGPPSPGSADPDWSATAAEFGSAVTFAALDALSELHAEDAEAAERYAAVHESDFSALIRQAPPPAVAADWWSALTPAASVALTGMVPLVVGNMGGVPYSARDAALRKYVEAFTPSGDDTAWDKTVENVRKQLDRKGVTAPRQVITLDPTDPDQPRAAISVGLLDDADNVTYLVPGMGTTPASDDALPSWLDSAGALQAEQADLAPGTTHSVIAWIGYDTPDPATAPGGEQSVALDAAAETGGDLLANEIRATDAVVSDDPRVNVVAHSYGSTVASEALQQVGVDSLAMVGSAGLTVDSADALKVPRGEVYAAESAGELVTMTMWNRTTYGSYPAAVGYDLWAPTGRGVSGRVNPDEIFGATRFSVDGSGTLNASHGHDSNPGRANSDGSYTSEGDGYLSEGTESLRNVAFITVGDGRKVSVS